MADADAPLFSVVVIARNESKTLPRLTESLKEFKARGGQLVLMDTGSTDGTQRLALDLGWEVHEATYTQRIGTAEAKEINAKFVKESDPELLEGGETFFDFSAARNNAAQFARCDVVAMPDCDEVYTKLDIDKINEAIRSGTHQFEYEFVFAHDSEGKPAVRFRHCKFYNKGVLYWTGIIHEILSPLFPKLDAIKRDYVDFIRLEHWQNPGTNRGNYLTGLAIDCNRNPNNDRNSHYFARELMYSGRYASAWDEFARHIKMNRWLAERAQSKIFQGDCAAAQGYPDIALEMYFEAWKLDGNRRLALVRIADHYYKTKDPQRCATFAHAALTVPKDSFYGNHESDYTWYPHEMLYWSSWQLGQKDAARISWNIARRYSPTNSKYLHDARFFMDLPKVSIVIPHVPDTRDIKGVLIAIQQNANYPNFEVHVEDDRCARGCPVTLNDGVVKTDGDLVMFLGDDCEPQPDFLIQAVLSHLDFKWKSRKDRAVTALNDGMWDGELATHWLADRDFKSALPTGVFFHEGYHHVGCDNELTGFAKKWCCYNYAPLSKIKHTPVDDEVHRLGWQPNLVARDRELLKVRCETYELDKEDSCCAG
jgi:glycosyltransferase involved in cell wall biosynthesis